ncbi:Bgt-20615 [Blumeria graminis f. sp. tritici]|uniref:Bgt-20615 n=1 Tax=Blumeria graminis f. sp. tritici TaxID=62690 RepID=A0A9X9MGP8_BLUGR|nr:Bgt-20615 [Blumeria graminis f. sp. tritici]
MDLGLSGEGIQISDISQTSEIFETKHYSVDPTPATQLHSRHITNLHTP